MGMKEIDELDLPETLRYTEDHEWADQREEGVRIGISDYAQDQLGDIVFVERPKIGDHLDKGGEFGTVESVKAVAELFMPVSGEVLVVNSVLEGTPELVNKDPYGDGWMIEVKPEEVQEMETLMTRDVYIEYLKGKE
jgi:glycine cleavage system H protein